MQDEKENVRDATEGSGRQQDLSPRYEANPIGQDSARNEYGEIGDEFGDADQPAEDADEIGDRQSHTEGEGFILRDDNGVSDEEGEDIRPS